jgi:hypothetical protein
LPDGAFLPYAADGRARVIATSGAARSQFFPEVPTFAEQGLKNIVVTEWLGFFMRSGTSEVIVSRAADAIANALRQPDLAEAFAKAGLVSAPSTPAELAQRLSIDRAYWGPAVKKTTGDGLLLEFLSVVDAVRCAVGVQTAIASRTANVADDGRIAFRIGQTTQPLPRWIFSPALSQQQKVDPG